MPYGVRLATAWSWRLLLVGAATAAVLWGLAFLSSVTVPILLALLLTALAKPGADWLDRRGLPRPLATVLVVVAGIVIVVGLVAFVSRQVAVGFGDLASQFGRSLTELERWLNGIGISSAQIQHVLTSLRTSLTSGGSQGLTQGVLSVTVTVGHVVAGAFIVLFATIFFIYDGRAIWLWLVRLMPQPARGRTDGAALRAWLVLSSYTRATVLVALVDAVGIGIVAAMLRLPLVVPIAVLVFLSSFVPIIGATLSGTVAVAVALVTHGLLSAVLMVVGVLAVQQLEAHVLQPFLMGRMVRVHPLAVVLVIAVGGLVAGIVGALLAVPTAAVANAVVQYLSSTASGGSSPASGSRAGPATGSDPPTSPDDPAGPVDEQDGQRA